MREDERAENIKYWENEVKKAMKEKDINRALMCNILLNHLKRKNYKE